MTLDTVVSHWFFFTMVSFVVGFLHSFEISHTSYVLFKKESIPTGYMIFSIPVLISLMFSLSIPLSWLVSHMASPFQTSQS